MEVSKTTDKNSELLEKNTNNCLLGASIDLLRINYDLPTWYVFFDRTTSLADHRNVMDMMHFDFNKGFDKVSH